MQLETLGDRIRYARINHAEMTQKQLADATGTSPSLVSALESGQREGTKNGMAFADALGVSIRWLMAGDGPMVVKEPKESFEKLQLAVTKFSLSEDDIKYVEEEAIKIAQEIFFNK